MTFPACFVAALLTLSLTVAAAQSLSVTTLAPAPGSINVSFRDVPLDHVVGGPRYLELVNATGTVLETRYLTSDPAGTVGFKTPAPGSYQVRLRYTGLK